jgi:hypothetical protein
MRSIIKNILKEQYRKPINFPKKWDRFIDKVGDDIARQVKYRISDNVEGYVKLQFPSDPEEWQTPKQYLRHEKIYDVAVEEDIDYLIKTYGFPEGWAGEFYAIPFNNAWRKIRGKILMELYGEEL